VISSTALYNAAKHKGLRGLAHPTYGTSFEPFLGRTSENALLPRTRVNKGRAQLLGSAPFVTLEAVMNSIRNGLGMRETEIAREPSRPWNPHHFYAIFAQVHNTL
jgi:hypothetical protein